MARIALVGPGSITLGLIHPLVARFADPADEVVLLGRAPEGDDKEVVAEVLRSRPDCILGNALTPARWTDCCLGPWDGIEDVDTYLVSVGATQERQRAVARDLLKTLSSSRPRHLIARHRHDGAEGLQGVRI